MRSGGTRRSDRRTVDDVERQRSRIEARLARIRELYKWGDYTGEQFQAECADLQCQLDVLPSSQADASEIEELAAVLKDIAAAWDSAAPEQRNHLLRHLVEDIWIDGDRAIGIRPRVDFEPFFKLRYGQPVGADEPTKNTSADQVSTDVLDWRKRRALLAQVPKKCTLGDFWSRTCVLSLSATPSPLRHQDIEPFEPPKF